MTQLNPTCDAASSTALFPVLFLFVRFVSSLNASPAILKYLHVSTAMTNFADFAHTEGFALFIAGCACVVIRLVISVRSLGIRHLNPDDYLMVIALV